MSTIYGESIFENQFIISESDLNIIVEYFSQNPEILDEAHWSKKELQDPETFKKLLDKFDKEKSIKGKIDNIWLTLSIADGILAGVLTKHISIGIVATIAAFIGKCFITIKTDSVLKNSQGNRIKQLREKAVKLRDKAAQLDDPESKKIVENCNKLIKEIDKYIANQEKAEYKKKYNEVKKLYIHTIQTVQEGIYWFPNNYYTLYAYKYAEILKLDVDRIEKETKKRPIDNELFGSLWELWFGEDDKDKVYAEYSQTIEVMSKYIPEFKDNGNTCNIIDAIDDTVLLYSKKTDLFYYGDYYYKEMPACKGYDVSKNIDKHLYPWIKIAMEDYKFDIDMDLLKAVDADLGYYRLTPPPKGVTPKKI